MRLEEEMGKSAPCPEMPDAAAAPQPRPAACAEGASRFTPDEIRRIFRPWEDAGAVLLAVSGGPDSVALMLLAAEWARAREAPRLSVATVDHGLRAGSGHEAEKVAGWAAALSLPHAILIWEGAKPHSRLQERAREARYGLLCAHAARAGVGHIMTAHHSGDQAETVLFRLLRGSGICGLAGMATMTRRGALTLGRPLLSYSKEELAAFCKAKAHPYFEDPSNADPRFARTKLRQLAARLASEGLDRAALLRLAGRAARAEAALSAWAAELRATLPAERSPGLFKANIAALASKPEEILLRFLASELKFAGFGRQLRLDRLESLTQELSRKLQAGKEFGATLGGAILRLRGDGILIITPEAGRKRGKRNPLEPSETAS